MRRSWTGQFLITCINAIDPIFRLQCFFKSSCVEGSCGGDDSGYCNLSVGDFDKSIVIVIISSSDGGDKLCKVDGVKDLTRNGKKMLGLSVSVNDFDVKGDATNSALHLSNLSRKEDNVKFTFVSTYSSLETVLNNLETIIFL